MFRKLLLSLMVMTVFLLHQDFWNWNKTEPLMFGFLPFGLAFHAAYAVLAAIMMALLVKFAWPTDLDRIESKLDDENKTPKP